MTQELDPVGREQSTKAADLSVNHIKNRFKNILPYDRTRIKLMKVDGKEGSDYINGNWMMVCIRYSDIVCTHNLVCVCERACVRLCGFRACV